MKTTKRPEHRALFSLRTRVWVHTCKRSLMLKYGKEKITAYQLAKSANKRDKAEKTQPGRWEQWAEGAPAHPTTVSEVDRSSDFTGAAGSFLSGPWIPIAKNNPSGAYIPLWKIIEADVGKILPIWKLVPSFAWRHWCRWEGYDPLEDKSQNPITQKRCYPKTDGQHLQFDWQLNVIKQKEKLEKKLNSAYVGSIDWLLDGDYSIERRDTGSTLIGDILKLEDQLNEIHRQLGLLPLETNSLRELLTRAEALLQVWRAGLKNDYLEHEWTKLEEELAHEYYSWLHEDVTTPPKTVWKPSLKTKEELSFLVVQCLQYKEHTPPLLQLAAAITLVKLNKEKSMQIDDTYSCPVIFADSAIATKAEIHTSVWDPLMADLEISGMNIDLLNQATEGYGIYITKHA